MTRTVPYDGRLRPLSELDPFTSNSFDNSSLSELLGTADQKLAEQRNKRSVTVKSRIRIQLSRPLTWAEKESLEKDGTDPHNRKLDGKHTFDGLKLWTSPERTHVWAEAPYGSRPLYDLVADVLAHDFVNVYPTAVRTFREYNGD